MDITTGSTGVAGEPGATGATGGAARNASTTTQSPCFGPRGECTDCGTLYILYSGWILTLYTLGWGVGMARESRVIRLTIQTNS